MELGLQNRVALIAGGSMGIGKASALALAREGAHLAICDRRKDLLEEVAQEISRETSQQILPIVTDMTREEEVSNFVATAVEHFGRLDILVNCVGSSPGGAFQNLTEAD